MSETHLLASWSEYSAAVDRMLGNARHSVVIFDRDLASLRLERAGTIASLTRLLRSSPSASLRISVQTAGLLRTHQPRLLELLRVFAHNFHAVETPPHLAHLSDVMLIVDNSSALIRFHNDHARSKEIINDPESCKPYCHRFDEIWNEGGISVSATIAGL